MLNKEIIRKKVYQESYNPYSAKKFVYDHRNIFDSWTGRYIYQSYPPIIKEISRFKDSVNYWFWVFFEDFYIIYKFDYKPISKEINEMHKDIKTYRKEG